MRRGFLPSSPMKGVMLLLTGALIAGGLSAWAIELPGTPSGGPQPACQEGGASSVDLKAEAFVKGPSLYLGDVATISGVHAGTLASIELGGAAEPGSSRRIDTAFVETRLRSSGVDPDAFRIGGSTSVVAHTLHTELSVDALTDELRRFVEDSMPWQPDQAFVDVYVQARDVVIPHGDIELVWRPNPQYNWIGAGTVRGEILVDGVVKRTLACRVNIDAYADAVVSVTDIPRGTPITASHLTVQKRSVANLRSSFLSDPQDAIGKLARSTIFPGELITARDVVQPQLVKRYQIVTVEKRVGGLMVRGKARAEAHGCEGDTIRCTNPQSKEEFFGVIRGDGIVMVQ